MEENERLSYLNEIVNEAKKRIIFYYKNLPESKTFEKEDVLKHTIETLDNLKFGEDFNYSDNNVVAYYRNEEINVTEGFYRIKTREEAVAVMIHEMNHAISAQNKNNYDVLTNYGDALYEFSYKIIEEGLADTNAEIIQNYYYDYSGEDIPNKFHNFDFFTCGYPFNRSVLKTILSILEAIGKDKEILLNYYYGDKRMLFDTIKELFGEDIFEYLRGDRYSESFDFDLMFNFFKDKFNSEMDKKDFSGKDFYGPSYNNVYYKNNRLLSSLRISYFIGVLLKRYDVSKVDKEMINNIYVDTNGLINRELDVIGIVPDIIDKLICSWINNCNVNEFKEIRKLVKDVDSINGYKYTFLMINKILGKNIDYKNLNTNDIDIIINYFNDNIGYNDDSYDSNEDSHINCYIYLNNFFELLAYIHFHATKEQKERFMLYKTWYYNEISKDNIINYLNEKFALRFGMSFEKVYMSKDVLMEMIKTYRSYIYCLDMYQSFEIINHIITSWIKNCETKDLYLICDLFPDTFERDNGKFYHLAESLGKVEKAKVV